MYIFGFLLILTVIGLVILRRKTPKAAVLLVLGSALLGLVFWLAQSRNPVIHHRSLAESAPQKVAESPLGQAPQTDSTTPDTQADAEPATTPPHDAVQTPKTADHIDGISEQTSEQEKVWEPEPIIGLVVDQQNQPVPDVAVYYDPGEEKEPYPICRTDAGGYFQILNEEGAVFGTLYAEDLRNHLSSHPVFSHDNSRDLPNGSRGLLIQMHDLAVIHIQFTDKADSRPLSGVAIQYFDPDGHGTRGPHVTDQQGRFRIQQQAGEFSLSAEKPGYRRLNKRITAKKGENQVALQLGTSYTLEGKITSLSGEPLPNTQIFMANGLLNESTMSKGDGHYRLVTEEPGPWKVIVKHPEHRQQFVEIGFAEGEFEQFRDFELEPLPDNTYDLSGIIVNKSGSPIVGAVIYSGATSDPKRATYSDERGEFTLTDISVDDLYIGLYHENYAPIRIRTKPQDGKHEDVTWEMPDEVRLIGTVLDPKGEPFDGLVRISFQDNYHEDQQGKYEWGFISPSGEYHIQGDINFEAPSGIGTWLHFKGYPPIMKPGKPWSQEGLVWQLEKDVLQVRVVDLKTGRPITEFEYARHFSQGAATLTRVVNSQGLLDFDDRYELDQPFNLEICAEGYRCKVAEIPANPEMPYEVALEKTKQAQITGQVIDEHGNPLAGVEVIALGNNASSNLRDFDFFREPPKQGFRLSQKTNRQGRFSFEPIEHQVMGIHLAAVQDTYVGGSLSFIDPSKDQVIPFPTPGRIFGTLNTEEIGYIERVSVLFTDFQQRQVNSYIPVPASENRYEMDRLKPGYYHIAWPRRNDATHLVTLMPGQNLEVNLMTTGHYQLHVSGPFEDPSTAVIQVNDGEHTLTQVLPANGHSFYFVHPRPADIHYWILPGAVSPQDVPTLPMSEARFVRLDEKEQHLDLWPKN